MKQLDSEETTRVLARLPHGVLVVSGDQTVRYANVAARRLLHPVQVRPGMPLGNVPSDPSLAELATSLVARRLLPEDEVRIGNRTLSVEGVFDQEERLGTFVLQDVTARIRRVRSEEDFVVNASHEILGPAAAIAGAAHVLKAGAKDDPAARDRFIGHIAEASDRLTSTTTALLVLAKAEAGLGGPRLELVPVRPVLEDVARGKPDVGVNCMEKVGVLADVDLLRQAVGTLVENARRHSHKGVRITAEEVGEMVAVDIVDRGGGILPENLERVTDRFFAGEGRDSGGYGIGLSIAARSAKVLGGTLDFASNRAGTRARLRFPSARLL